MIVAAWQEELEHILKAQAGRYPLMQPTDAVKLIYQNEFGGGHLIRDEESCLEFLRREYAAVEKNMQAMEEESIGNGMVRVHLGALNAEKLEALGQRFLRSAAQHTGDKARFLEKLELLRQMTREGCFGFDSEALEDYLQEYKAAGYPMVSHSQRYRQAYRPAYRVVREE